jgi:hypothetical protein
LFHRSPVIADPALAAGLRERRRDALFSRVRSAASAGTALMETHNTSV